MTANPSVGLDARTGGTIVGWAHVVQSLHDIFTTRFGSRVMREWYGSFVPDALGRNINREELLPVIASVTSALEQWEPRFRLVDMAFDGDLRKGNLRLTLSGMYRPFALLGNVTEDGRRDIAIAIGAGRASIIQ